VLWLAYDSNAHPGVVDADDAVVVFLGNHERGQVGSVAGSEEDGKQRPHVGHEPAGDTSRGVHVHRRSEQHRPDQPERTEQRKPVLCGTHDADTTIPLFHLCGSNSGSLLFALQPQRTAGKPQIYREDREGTVLTAIEM